MTTSAECGCDEAKHWQARALRAEASLALATSMLRATSAKIGDLLEVLPTEESDTVAATLNEGIAGFTVVEGFTAGAEPR